MRKLTILGLLLALFGVMTTAYADPVSVRIKDVAKVQGVRDNQLVGYGLVVGLAGTGDGSNTLMTARSIANTLQAFGVNITAAQITSKNVAAVMVTATLPAFVKSGDQIDVTLASLGDAKSLQGGLLLMCPLKAANNAVYAVAQGPVTLGGYSAGTSGSSSQKAFPTTGRVPSGAIVERDVPTHLLSDNNNCIRLALMQPDFTTATRIADAVNDRFANSAAARDAGTVEVTVPGDYRDNLVPFVAALEELTVQPDAIAKVVINERTGTIVMGDHVHIAEVAVAHGSLQVKIQTSLSVSQPPPFSGGSTVVTAQTNTNADEPNAKVLRLPPSSTVRDLVTALNAVGAAPSDIIAILQAIKDAGALHAVLEVI